MTDPAKTYPGSKQVRRLVRGDTVEPEAPEWRIDPRSYLVNGKPVEFFAIGSLATALNRSVQTVRRWERKGWIPEATFRTSGKKKDRLYTEVQIKGLLMLAREADLLDPSSRKPVGDTDFPARAHKLFERLEQG